MLTEIALTYFKKIYFIYGQTPFNFRTNKLIDEWNVYTLKQVGYIPITYLIKNGYIEYDNSDGEMRFTKKFEELL